MASIVIATANEDLRSSLAGALLEAGNAVGFASEWDHLVELVARRSTRVVVVDPALTGVDGVLLARLAASLHHPLQVFSVAGSLPPLPELPHQPLRFRKEIARQVGPTIPAHERTFLRLLGVGPRPLQVLANVARSSLPICVQGERGTGKKRVAQVLHRLAGGGAFVSLNASGASSLPWRGDSSEESTGGFVYVALGDDWPADLVASTQEHAIEAGYRVIVGTRLPPPEGAGQWAHLVLTPLRERPADLHDLCLHYLELHRQDLGLPRRRLGRSLWSAVLAHRWPGNARELESFVVSLLSSVERPLIQLRDLPPAVRVMVDPREAADAPWVPASFEAMVETQLRRVVSLYERGGEGSLYEMVIDGTERPLFRLVLARTGGNQKNAARLLGLSRNTLRTHLEHLGLRGGQTEGD